MPDAGPRQSPQDADSGGGTDARVEIYVSAGATVLIRANALSEGMQGAYTLQVTRR